ncbi:hypothetical protein PoB_000486700 [Plakobranchus ocellatus]|uniref:Uncharacterized protein n=1 Tax=Plakobranchus ocellatus TaxID=259542 RepID=A0AAV3Y6D4_9GAST|nr:hypothetical protein PoB_000486700 [Plakobranchus ocellatus]
MFWPSPVDLCSSKCTLEETPRFFSVFNREEVMPCLFQEEETGEQCFSLSTRVLTAATYVSELDEGLGRARASVRGAAPQGQDLMTCMREFQIADPW